MRPSKRTVHSGSRTERRNRVAARSAVYVLFWLAALSLSAYAVTGSIRGRVPAAGAQRADTLTVGVPGYVDVTVNVDTPDSISAVVLAFLMQFAPGPAAGIERITIDDWEWFGAYQNFGFRGFDSAYQDGSVPDSGLMYALVFNDPAAYYDDTLVARFWVTASSAGTLVFDTLTITDGLVENLTTLHLYDAGPIDVTNNLTFDFPPIVVVEEASCPIALTGDVSLDGSISSSDVIFIVNYVFKSGAAPSPCEAAADVNCDGAVAASDIIALVNYVFKGGAPPCDVCALIPGTWSCP